MYKGIQTDSIISVCFSVSFYLSGRDDSNVRPLAPHASALANCATPRLFVVAKLGMFFDLQNNRKKTLPLSSQIVYDVIYD